VDEELFLTYLRFLQDINAYQFLQIARRCLTLGNFFIDNVADAAIGLLEYYIYQLA